MALDTYTNLQAEIGLWLRRTDLGTEIPSFISLAEAQLNRDLRSVSMLARTPLSITGSTVGAPADLTGVRSLRITDSAPPQTLRWTAPEQMDELLDSLDYTAGIPTHYSLEGASFRFSPSPGATFTGSLLYYQRLPALSNSNASNWLLAAHPDAYLYGALLQATAYVKTDERLPVWRSAYDDTVAAINAAGAGIGGVIAPIPQTLYAGAV